MNNIYLYSIFIILIITIITYNNSLLENFKEQKLKPVPNSFIKNLYWRRAEKHFLPGPVDINSIKSAILNSLVHMVFNHFTY